MELRASTHFVASGIEHCEENEDSNNVLHIFVDGLKCLLIYFYLIFMNHNYDVLNRFKIIFIHLTYN
jgi:hypothetical protein